MTVTGRLKQILAVSAMAAIIAGTPFSRGTKLASFAVADPLPKIVGQVTTDKGAQDFIEQEFEKIRRSTNARCVDFVHNLTQYMEKPNYMTAQMATKVLDALSNLLVDHLTIAIDRAEDIVKTHPKMEPDLKSALQNYASGQRGLKTLFSRIVADLRSQIQKGGIDPKKVEEFRKLSDSICNSTSSMFLRF